ncbi:hypothetical protein EMMF5_000653 [Cystobasidiomycetes sp. EMM_F5]
MSSRTESHIPENEKDYISDYMARAFDRHDLGSFVATGCLVSLSIKTFTFQEINTTLPHMTFSAYTAVHLLPQYEKDPLSHRLFFRSIMDRTPLAGGLFTTTTNRNVFATRWPPGVADKTMDFDWRSGNDASFDTWVARCGGREAVQNRLEKYAQPWDTETDKIYGKGGTLQHIRGMWLGCNPDNQQTGHARAIHEANVNEADKLGCKVIFGSYRKNVPIYKRIGARPVGNEFHVDYPAPPEYGTDWQDVHVMEGGGKNVPSKL